MKKNPKNSSPNTDIDRTMTNVELVSAIFMYYDMLKFQNDWLIFQIIIFKTDTSMQTQKTGVSNAVWFEDNLYQ